MRSAWPLAVVLAIAGTACGHAESPGANVALGPSRACAEGQVDDGFECVSKHASDHRADGDDDGEQPLAKKKPSTDCGPFDDCDEVASSPHGKDEEDDFNVALKAFRAHDYTNARRLFFAMLQAHPDGRHPDDAYFYFGKMFEDEGLQDPTKLPLAAQSFEQVLMYPTS